MTSWLELVAEMPEEDSGGSSMNLYRPPGCPDLHYWIMHDMLDLVEDAFYAWKITVFPSEAEPWRKTHPGWLPPWGPYWLGGSGARLNQQQV